MYERILVPLDGSKGGEAALPYVEALVSKLVPGVKVEVILFQVITRMTHAVVGGEAAVDIPYTEEELGETERKAMDYLDKAGETLRSKGAVVKARVGIGSAAEEIVKAADEIKADMIAMKTTRLRIMLYSVTPHPKRGSAGTGRRAGLRIRCSDAWGFESPLPHSMDRKYRA